MKDKILSFISNLIKQYFMVFIVLSLMMGGIVGFIFANKKVNTSCVLAMEETKEEEKPKNVMVDLSGAVKYPGLYELEEGSRIGDLLALGGTLNETSSTWVSKNLNLSKKLEDSTKIYIPFEWETYVSENNEIVSLIKPKEKSNSSSNTNSSSSDTSNTSDNTSSDTPDNDGNGDNDEVSSKINVNTSSSSDLDTLPGIGPSYAQKIIDNRPYKDFAEFESKSGLYKSTSASIKDLISF